MQNLIKVKDWSNITRDEIEAWKRGELDVESMSLVALLGKRAKEIAEFDNNLLNPVGVEFSNKLN